MFLATLGRPHAVALGVIAVLVTACAVAPIQEMSDARQALQSAREIGADRYAPKQIETAEGEIAEAEELLGEGDSQFSAARSKAVAAKETAIEARELTVALARAQQSLTQAGASGLDTAAWQTAFDSAVEDARLGKSAEALEKAKALTQTVDAAIAASAPPQ